MYVSKLMVYMQKVEEEKLRDREEYGNKKAMTGNEPRQQKSGSNRPQFQKQKGHAPSSSSAPAPIDRVEHHVHHSRARPTYSQSKQCSGNGGNRAQSSSVAPQGNTTFRGGTSGVSGGTNRLYILNSHQEQENSSDVVTEPSSLYAKYTERKRTLVSL
ncbi:uncharacterized protein [Solanum lycopersicum]|uniref:uncharacterized protein n=1 Tax=Solanum lycopersicum TaxID=4081 RepID=UPI003748094B